MIPALALALGVSAFAAPSPAADYQTYAKLYARLMAGEKAVQLEDVLPALSKNLRTSADVSAKYWTDCTPFDELAKAAILPDKVMDALGIAHTTTGGVVHAPAGLMHTYGYLFSQLQTAYGLKGKRWLESRLDERLGLPAGTFSPLTFKGEFTSNVTAALMELIGAKIVLPRAVKFIKPSAKVVGHVEQRVSWKTAKGRTEAASVFTHLVELKPLPGLETSDAYLLIYSTLQNRRRRLVTAFPVDQKFAESIMKTPPGKSASFSPRFNLYIDPSWKTVLNENLGFQP